MKQAKINQLKNQLSHYLNHVRHGERVRVYDRDLAIADIVPITAQSNAASTDSAWVNMLESAGVIKRPLCPLTRDLLASPPGNKEAGNLALRLLLADREDE